MENVMSLRRRARGRAPVGPIAATSVALVALIAWVALGGTASAQRREWSVTGGRAEDSLGASVSYVPDVDGDGVVDLLLGAPGVVFGGPVTGKVFLYSGRKKTVLREFDGDTRGDAFGSLVADLGDVDGDGVRDFACTAPYRSVPGSPMGAVFVVSGTGSVLQTYTSTSSTGQVGSSMTWVGDVDGDGVRDLIYADEIPFNNKVFVKSGKTGATIRKHTSSAANYGILLGRAGDLDADGVEDYVIGDLTNTFAYSGATGGQLFKISRFERSAAPAGDVDGDGHGDLLLANPNETPTSGVVRVVSGATAKELYRITQSGAFGVAISTTADVDADGRPDFVVARDMDPADPNYDGNDVFVYSGASGQLVTEFGLDTSLVAIDATADLNGDGTPDVLAGDSYWRRGDGSAGPNGRVYVASSSDGARLATITGAAFAPKVASASTLLDDLDGDGWRDVALVVPGGLEDASPDLVQVVSGRDGHELSRLHTLNTVLDLDHGIVAIGDVNGDAIGDFAVSAPGGSSNAVELHSGADNSLIATIVPPSGLPRHLAAAADVNGTPLLAIVTATPPQVDVYDLTTDTLVSTFDVHVHSRVSCVGDVNQDGTVDWALFDDVNRSGAVAVVSGGSSPQTIWRIDGTRTSHFDDATSVGDLDGDGFDDVLAAIGGDVLARGKVAAYSGVNGKKLFELDGTANFESFGSYLAPLGDVNRDGVDDFAIGAAGYGSLGAVGAIFVYSGRTVSELYRLDAANSGDLSVVTIANRRWHDDARVDPDPSSDLVVGLPYFDSDRGRAQLFRLDDLMLQVDPPNPPAGARVTATTHGGPAGGLAGLYAVDLSGVPFDYFLALGTFDAMGDFAVTDTVPSSMQGLTFDVISYGVGFNGKVADSELTAIVVQ
jgi:hypothetical protein